MATLEAFDPAQPIEVSCRKFGEFLGLNRPVAPDVLLAAISDPVYAHHLMVSRGTPEFMERLLQYPPTPKKSSDKSPETTATTALPAVSAPSDVSPVEPGDAPAAAGVIAPESAEFSNAELLKKAATAVWRWSRTGFSEIDDETYKRRLAACNACEHLKDPPAKVLYRLASANSVDRKICGLCGCVVTRKAKIPSERCPARMENDPSLNRWGEPATAQRETATAS